MPENLSPSEIAPAFGRFRVLKQLGEGGMATVQLAELQGAGGFSRKVALKVVHAQLAHLPEFARLFTDEGRLGGYLTHNNIIQTIDFGEHQGRPYLAMEFVDGPSLHQVLNDLRARHSLLPLDVALQMLIPLCHGLDYAHRAVDHQGTPLQLVHRDLKPSNILLTRYGEVKLCDLGVARAVSNLEHTEYSGMVKGTPRYMSPEQARGLRNIDHRSDLFAVGVIAYELFTGFHLYEEQSNLLILRLAQDAVVSSQLQHVPESPIRLDLIGFLARALAHEPQDRFQSAEQMSEVLEALLDSLPQRTRPRAWMALMGYGPREAAPGFAPGPSLSREPQSEQAAPALSLEAEKSPTPHRALDLPLTLEELLTPSPSSVKGETKPVSVTPSAANDAGRLAIASYDASFGGDLFSSPSPVATIPPGLTTMAVAPTEVGVPGLVHTSTSDLPERPFNLTSVELSAQAAEMPMMPRASRELEHPGVSLPEPEALLPELSRRGSRYASRWRIATGGAVVTLSIGSWWMTGLRGTNTEAASSHVITAPTDHTGPQSAAPRENSPPVVPGDEAVKTLDGIVGIPTETPLSLRFTDSKSAINSAKTYGLHRQIAPPESARSTPGGADGPRPADDKASATRHSVAGLRRSLEASSKPKPSRPAEPVKLQDTGTGFLYVNTMPPADIVVDGKVVGNTTVERYEIKPGVHELQFNSIFFKSLPHSETIEPGTTVRCFASLRDGVVRCKPSRSVEP